MLAFNLKLKLCTAFYHFFQIFCGKLFCDAACITLCKNTEKLLQFFLMKHQAVLPLYKEKNDLENGKCFTNVYP